MPRNAIGAARQRRVPTARALLLTLTAAGSIGQAQAQPPARLETVTVTGSRLGQPPAGTASVIGPTRIEETFKAGLPALLAELPGVFTTLPGGRGSVGEVILRGGEPNFTAVLVDGTQVNDPTNTRGGSFDFSTLDLTEIERIELLRGPLSSIYGSDSLSGIVNIVTHEPLDVFASHARISLGSDAYSALSAGVGGPWRGGNGFSVNAATLRDGRNDDTGGYRSNSLNGKLALALSSESQLTLHARHSSTELHAYPDSSGGPLFAVSSEQDRREVADDSFAANWRRTLSDRTQLHVAATLFEHDERIASPGVAPGVGGAIPPNRANNDFSRRLLSVFVNTELDRGFSAALGASLEAQRGRSAGTLELAPGVSVPSGYALERDNVALFGELGYAASDRLDLGFALRIDDGDTAARETTGRLSAGYSIPGTATRLRIAWATGYKLPSLFSLGDALVGNPLLESETVQSWEIGIETGGGADRFGFAASVFAQRFDNLIDFDFEQFMSVNRDRVRTDGVEIRARYRIAETLSWTVHGTWLDIDVAGSAETLRQRPRRHGGIGVEWTPHAALTIYAGWRQVGERLDAAIPTGERALSGYSRADAALTWHASETTRLQLAIDNVTDERYEDAIGFPSLGRRLRLSIRTALSGIP